MPRSDSYFLSRFSSRDSEGMKKRGKRRTVKRQRRSKGNKSNEKERKDEPPTLSAPCVQGLKLPFPFLLLPSFRLHILVLSYRDVLLVLLWVSVKL